MNSIQMALPWVTLPLDREPPAPGFVWSITSSANGEQARRDRDFNRLCSPMAKSNRDSCGTGSFQVSRPSEQVLLGVPDDRPHKNLCTRHHLGWSVECARTRCAWKRVALPRTGLNRCSALAMSGGEGTADGGAGDSTARSMRSAGRDPRRGLVTPPRCKHRTDMSEDHASIS